MRDQGRPRLRSLGEALQGLRRRVRTHESPSSRPLAGASGTHPGFNPRGSSCHLRSRAGPASSTWANPTTVATHTPSLR